MYNIVLILHLQIFNKINSHEIGLEYATAIASAATAANVYESTTSTTTATTATESADSAAAAGHSPDGYAPKRRYGTVEPDAPIHAADDSRL